MNVPSTFIFESKNPSLLPPPLLKVFIKNLFRFGRGDTKIVNNRIHLFLSYSPKNETVEKKLKNLPVKYIRVAADDEEELNLFIRGMQKFTNVNFCIEDENIDDDDDDGSKKVEVNTRRAREEEEEEEQEEEGPDQKKIKILENRMVAPAKKKAVLLSDPSPGPSSLVEIMDDDEDAYEAQKYSVHKKFKK